MIAPSLRTALKVIDTPLPGFSTAPRRHRATRGQSASATILRSGRTFGNLSSDGEQRYRAQRDTA